MAGQDRKRQVARERYERKRAEYAAKRVRQRRRNIILSAVGAVILVAGLTTWLVVSVGGDGKPLAAPGASGSPTPSASPSPAPTTAPGCTSPPIAIPTPKPNFPILPAAAGPELAKPPTITVPAGPIPAKLQTKDLVVGKGATIATGDQLTANYAGYDYLTCVPFDSSWSRQDFQPFTVGTGMIDGFGQGLVGMKVGGRREIIVPPSLGYGAEGSPPVIGPNETLVFVVDVVAATQPSPKPSPAATAEATP